MRQGGVALLVPAKTRVLDHNHGRLPASQQQVSDADAARSVERPKRSQRQQQCLGWGKRPGPPGFPGLDGRSRHDRLQSIQAFVRAA